MPYMPKGNANVFSRTSFIFYFNEQVKCINGYRFKNNSHIDIFIPSKNIGIEYDGPKHKTPIQKARDERKNIFLQKMGIKLYRVIESENLVLKKIQFMLSMTRIIGI